MKLSGRVGQDSQAGSKVSWEKKERRLVWLLFGLVNGLGEGSYMHYLNFLPGSTGFPDGLLLKNLPANAGAAEDPGSVFGWGRPQENGMATHLSILAWRLPSTEEPGGLQCMELQRTGHHQVTDHAPRSTEREHQAFLSTFINTEQKRNHSGASNTNQ